MKFKILIFLILCLFYKIYAQKDCACNYITDYYPLVYKGQLNYLKENYDSAYVYLKEAEENCPLLDNLQTNEISMLLEISVRKNLYEDATEYLKMKLINGFEIKYLVEDSLYSDFIKAKEFQKVSAKADEIYRDWHSGIDLELRNKLVSMNKEDQKVRREKPIDFEKMKQIDSININALKEIIAEYGYPSKNLVGNYSVDEHPNVYTLIMHIQGEENLNYFKPIFLEWVRCGKTDYTSIYANLVDSNDRSRGVFTYGIYSNIKPEQIKDFENLDERRVSVGLRPWEMEKEVQELLRLKYDLH